MIDVFWALSILAVLVLAIGAIFIVLKRRAHSLASDVEPSVKGDEKKEAMAGVSFQKGEAPKDIYPLW